MKYFISLILCCSLYKHSRGQYDLDSARNVQYKEFAKELDCKFVLKKTNNLEFRLWTKGSITSYVNVFILAKNEEKWNGRFFELLIQDKNKIWAEKQINQSDLDSLWRKLVKNNILVLPTQDSLKSRMKSYTIDSTFLDSDEEMTIKRVYVMDGVSYRFEIRSKNVNRDYYYDNPEEYLKYYPHIEEFFRAYIIISSIKRYLGIPLSY